MAEQGDSVTSNNSCLLCIRSTRPILAPIENSKKIKYTCIAASESYVALGANTGGVYCFHRNGYKYIRILASKEGGVSIVRFSPAQDYLAVCNGGGFVILWELNLQEQGISRRIHVCSLLKDGIIRDLVWDKKGTRVFLGDDQGRVAITYPPKGLFKKPDELLLQEKVPIIQLDFHAEQLLVSTQSRCIIHRLVTKETVQIGTKVRDGAFGACFYSRGADRPPIVFSARPGGRLWQADIAGTVVSTLKLKDAVTMPAAPVLGLGFSPNYSSSSKHPLPSSLNFPRLALLQGTLMVAWLAKEVFLFEPTSYRLAAWTAELGRVVDLYCDGRQLFVLCEGVEGIGVRVVSFVSLVICIKWLVKLELMDQAAKVLETQSEEVSRLLDSDSILYTNVCTVLSGLEDTPNHPLQALQERVAELADKYSHVITNKVSTVEPETEGRGESNIEEHPQLEDGFQTVDLNAYSTDQLDSTIKSDQATVSDHVINDVNHVTPDLKLINGHVTLDRDSSADFPFKFASNNRMEPNFDTMLIPVDQTEPILDTIMISDDLADPLASSGQASLTQEHLRESMSRSTSEPNSRRSSISLISAFHESTGKEKHIHSQSQTIPNQTLKTVSLDNPPECGTSVLSSSFGASETQSRSSLEQGAELEIKGQQRGTPEFAQRVAAVLSSVSPDDDDVVVAIPVRSNSGSSRDGRKSKKRSSRKKKSASPQNMKLSTPELTAIDSLKSSPSRSISLVHIPEESLPFPEAGLPTSTLSSQVSHPHTPPTRSSQVSTSPSHDSHLTSHQSLAPTSLNVSPHLTQPHSPPSHPPHPHNLPTQPVITSSTIVQNGFIPTYTEKPQDSLAEAFPEPSLFPGLQRSLSKVKSMAKQGMVESNKLVKDLLSTLASPTPSQDSQPSLYINDGFAPSVSPPPVSSEGVTLSTPPLADEDEPDAPELDQETLEFLEATNTTWTLLEDPAVFCSPSSMTTPLTEWLPRLATYRTHLLQPRIEGEATIRSWSLPTDFPAKEIVTDLSSLALELGCYGDDLSLQGMTDFVCQYYAILDMRRVWEVLSQQEWAVRVGVWRQLADTVDPGVGSLSDLCSDHAQLYRLPALMTRLCRESQDSFTAASVSLYPSVLPWEVAAVCESDQSDGQDQSHDSDAYRLYLIRLVESVPVKELISMWGDDVTLLMRSFAAALSWNREESVPLLDILVRASCQLKREGLETARNLCTKHRYWLGVVRLSVAMGDKRRALLVLLYLRDFSLLSGQINGDLLCTVEDWQLLLDLISSSDLHLKITPTSPPPPLTMPTASTTTETTTHYTPSQPKELKYLPADSASSNDQDQEVPCDGEHRVTTELTWAGLLRLMIGTLPAHVVLKLLSGYHGNGFGSLLSKQLHGVLTELVQTQARQRAVAHGLLERVDQYLWSPRPTALAPQLLTVQQSEIGGVQRHEDNSPIMVTSVTPLSEWLEDAGVHWGVRCANSCPICRLSLLSPISDLEPGVIALRCGHAYHKRCLPEAACVECFSESLKTATVTNTD